jgi:prepilin-type N-terminal cleavage/methylation domain
MKSEKRNKRMNNKGFSLVELIVVMAIMAILAVTLAPKLMHYVEKARIASDRQVVNSIYDATKLSLADETLDTAFKSIATEASGVYTLALKSSSTVTSVYATTDGNEWTVTTLDNAFAKELQTVIDGFNLKATEAGTSTSITIVLGSDNKLSVTLDYSGSTFAGNDYRAAE